MAKPIFPSYTVPINYDQTVEILVKASKQDAACSDITSSHFPSFEKGDTQVEIFLVNFEHDIGNEDVIKEMSNMNPLLRPATLKELLALAIGQPDLQRKNQIVALGSTWSYSNNCIFVPYLTGGDSYRNLHLDCWGGDWSSDWRFAAVHKK